MAYAAGDHRSALFATAIVLLLAIVILNAMAGVIRGGRFGRRKRHVQVPSTPLLAASDSEDARLVSR
jgi:hypothetical protein